MLEGLFLSVLNMSMVSSYVILFMLIARLWLRKAPKIFTYSVWSIVLFRLLCPVSFESVFSLVPMREGDIVKNIIYSVPKINTDALSPNSLSGVMPPVLSNGAGSITPTQIWLYIGIIIWILGIFAMVVYSIFTFVKLKRNLIGAVHLKDNIYLVDQIPSPFVMGLYKPKIYLPSSLSKSEMDFIIAHEECHIKRLDHFTRILSFTTLAIHWFNPLVWVAFILSGKDMEMSCDEAVMKKTHTDIRREYSQSLLRFSYKGKIHATPLAFGEGGTKTRIKNILNYKRPTFWVIVVTAILAILVGFGLAANPKTNPTDVPKVGEDEGTVTARRPMVMVNDILYLDTGKEAVEAIDNEAILGKITSAVSGSEKPTKEGQCNFESGLGAMVASYNDGIAVFLDNKWFFFERENETEVDVAYSMMKLGKNGEIISQYSLNNQEFAREIIMNALVKSVLVEGVDISALDECYLIRKSFVKEGEVKDYYAYLLEGKTAVLQSGTKGRGSELSMELYLKLEKFFNISEVDNPIKLVKFGLSDVDAEPQKIGEAAFYCWMDIFTHEETPEEIKIATYTLDKLSVVSGTPKQGQTLEDMKYHYVVKVDYSIKTDSEEYLSAGDGISGKGEFSGLFRELCVKALGKGEFQIFSIGTGGGEQEFSK